MAIYRNHFYHGLNRKYTAIFGQLFSGIEVLRYNLADMQEITRERVPIDYGPKEKWYRGYTEDPEFQRFIANKLPRMSWELAGWNFDPMRAQNNNLPHRELLPVSGNGSDQFFYSPIPYDLTFNLHVLVKSQDDLHQILEQIIPAFKPDIVLRMKPISTMNYEMDVPINLLSVQSADTYDGKLQELRLVTATLVFILKGWFIGPVRKSGVITKAITNINTDAGYVESYGLAPYVDGKDLGDVLSTDEYEFLRLAGYFPDNTMGDALEQAYVDKQNE